jgi:hypothetical protein
MITITILELNFRILAIILYNIKLFQLSTYTCCVQASVFKLVLNNIVPESSFQYRVFWPFKNQLGPKYVRAIINKSIVQQTVIKYYI